MLPQQLGPAVPVLFGLVVASLVANLAVYYVARSMLRARSPADGSAPSPDGPVPDDRPGGDVVRCPDCGVANEPEYRFCRACVSDLGTGTRFDWGGSPPFGRFIG